MMDSESEGEQSQMACSPFFFRKQKQVYFCLWQAYNKGEIKRRHYVYAVCKE